jgi:hypothetical protein
MSDLVAFLTARLDEIESGWKAHRRREREGDLETLFHFGRPLAEELLADIAAKRRIVELHTDTENHAHGCPGRGALDDEWHVIEAGQPLTLVYPCPTLRLLASVYADHSDYREEWKP